MLTLDFIDYTLQIIGNEDKNLDDIHRNAILDKYKHQCVLCNKKEGDVAVYGTKKKLEYKLDEKWFIRKAKLMFHKVGSEFVIMCCRCHFNYHQFQNLTDETVDDWLTETHTIKSNKKKWSK